jgi:hypothetical protein
MKKFPRLDSKPLFQSSNASEMGVENYKSLFQEALNTVKEEENPFIKAAYLSELDHKLTLTPILFAQEASSHFKDIAVETKNLFVKTESESLEKLSLDLKQIEESLHQDEYNSLNKRLELYIDHSYNLALLRSVPNEDFSEDFQRKLNTFETQLEELFKKKEISFDKDEKKDISLEKEEFIQAYKEELNNIVKYPHSQAYDKLFQLIFHTKKLDYVFQKTSLLHEDEFKNLKGELSTVSKSLEEQFFQESRTDLEDTLKNDSLDLTDISNVTYPLTILNNIPTNLYSNEFLPKLSSFYMESIERFIEKSSRVHLPTEDKKQVELEEECRGILERSVEIPMLRFDKANTVTQESIPLHDPSSSFKNGDIILKGLAGKAFMDRIQKGESQESILADLKNNYPTDCFKMEDASSNTLQNFISGIEKDKLSHLFAEKFNKERAKLQGFKQNATPTDNELINYKVEKITHLVETTKKLEATTTYQELLEVSLEYQNNRRQLRNNKFNEWNQKKIGEEPQIKKRIENWKIKKKADIPLSS